jgi:selenium donor protein
MAVAKAREQVAALIECDPDEIIFTSGGTESNNFAIQGIAFANQSKGNHIITSAIEHPAVIEVCKYLEKKGFRITYVPVDKNGLIRLKEVVSAITPETILITIMHANNEVGTIQPIEEISKTAIKNKIPFHTDAAQSLGKIPVSVKTSGVDLLSIAGHKLYAPKGVGALYVKHGINLEKIIHGADHERNMRPGTENVIEIVGLGKACEIAGRDLEKNRSHMKKMRDILANKLTKGLKNARINGDINNSLPNTLSIGFRNTEANTLISELDHVAASAGAACHTDNIDISHVLTAMKVPVEFAMGTIRFSTGRFTTEEEINLATDEIIQTVKNLGRDQETSDQPLEETGKIKLTHFTQGLGCACKLRPQALEEVLKDFNVPTDPDILVGINTSDDAAVYKLNKDTALVKTVDFFTPVVDDPFQFGQIAAANALSDIYAMGAIPLFALNIVGFPSYRLPLSVLRKILEGANKKAAEAGISIIGGHTIDDSEPKYGMAVTGKVHPDRILTNSAAQPGDQLILTKSIGTGILSTALKRGLLENDIREKLISLMADLNKTASETMQNYPVNACTDVSGFGLLGHLLEMARASKVEVNLFSDKVPVIKNVKKFVTANIVPGGTSNNLDYVSEFVEWPDNFPESNKIILADAQTSGGLLISVPQVYTKKLVNELKTKGVLIGEVINKKKGKIIVY